jgi:hypothetical protein
MVEVWKEKFPDEEFIVEETDRNKHHLHIDAIYLPCIYRKLLQQGKVI